MSFKTRAGTRYPVHLPAARHGRRVAYADVRATNHFPISNENSTSYNASRVLLSANQNPLS